MYAESILVDGHTESESYNFTIYMKNTSCQAKGIEVMQCIDKGATFVTRTFVLVAVVHFAPFGFQIETFLYTVGSERNIFIISIGPAEFIEVVPFGLEFLTGQCGKVGAKIQVIGIIPVRFEMKLIRHYGFQVSPHACAYSEHTEAFTFTVGIFYHILQHFL